jgi:hypothetical protein
MSVFQRAGLVCFVVSWLVACDGSSSATRSDAGPSNVADTGAVVDARGGVRDAQSGGIADTGPGDVVESGLPLDGALGEPPDSSSTKGDGSTIALLDAGPYPAGPYGNTVGDTLIDLPLQGYLNESGVGLADLQPFVKSYSLDELRRTGSRYALIHVSAFF